MQILRHSCDNATGRVSPKSCDGVSNSQEFDTSANQQIREPTTTTWLNTFPHSMEDVFEAADFGCPFFMWLWDQILRSGTSGEQLLRTRIALLIQFASGDRKDAFRCTVNISTHHYTWNPNPAIFDLVSDAWDPTAEEAIERTIDGGVFHESGLAQIRRRLDVCFESHADCQQEPGVRPSQFLYVDDLQHDTVSLKAIDQASSQPYIALSYCWGVDQPIKTTRSNWTSHTDQINVDSLPKTIQDAIHVTRSLGFHLLWVDSLCIIQDAPELLAREVDNMAHYYTGAAVTISAAASKSCQDGFLRPLYKKEDPSLPVFHLPAHLNESRHARDSHLKLVPPQDLKEHIDSRGWTLQESMLSTRLVTFGARRISWSCRTKTYGHSVGPAILRQQVLGLHRNAESRYQRLRDRLTITAHDSPERLIHMNHHDGPFFQLWSAIIEEYSSRSLTAPEDRLPAISGIAKMMEYMFRPPTRGRNIYMAGLWDKRDLPIQLLWMSKTSQAPRPPGAYIAPSWSWASASGPVYWRIPQRMLTSKEIAPYDWTSRSEVQNVSMQYANDNAPYGAVVGGSITLSGFTFDPSQVSPGDIQLRFDTYGEVIPLDAVDWSFWCEVGDLLCVHLFSYEPDVEDKLQGFPHGLILASNDDGTYRRVGVYINHKWEQTPTKDRHYDRDIIIV
ncbi:uncharacterized protein CTRU02_208064 [Colletotrichum truncatum]|uniref:Uncharacterized protein n=1 Tax=Colletotrichum truncatum TaxID=5467 RepID=A0ACC3YVA7_COLTU